MGEGGRLRVLQLISSAGFYGAEAVVVSLSKQLNELGVVSTLGVFHNAHRPNLELAECAKRQNLAVEIVCCKGRLDWGTIRAIREVVQRLQIDVIHTHGYKSHVYGCLAARGNSCALVATCHGYHSAFEDRRARLLKRLYASIENVVFRRFDAVVAVSHELSDSLRQTRIDPLKLPTIANGVDVECFACACPSADLEKIKAGRLAIGVVGRLTEGKGHRQFLQAGKAILARHSNALLLVVGDGPSKAQLEASALELEIGAGVVFTGRREDMASVYAALDIVVLPSLFEGMPVVVLEALAAKRAMVATKVGAIPELVVNDNTGLLVEPGDVMALEDAIQRLITDADLRRSLGMSGHMRVRERFSAANMAQSYLRTYEKVIESRNDDKIGRS